MSTQKTFLAAFISTLFILLASLYFQFWKHLEPCALCITQRVLFFVIAVVLFIALLLRPSQLNYKITSSLVFIFSGMGLYFSGRQIWLQHLPAEKLPDCGPSFNLLVENFPLNVILKELLTGSAQCGVVTWEFLGVTMAGWAFGFFLILALVGIRELFRFANPL